MNEMKGSVLTFSDPFKAACSVVNTGRIIVIASWWLST
jgi:hypothetical protein